jgi:sodium/bile acid cotransporter 7
MPTTLSAGVALTQLSKGNVAVALLLTVVSNALGVFSIPIVLPLVLGSAFGGGVFEGTALFKSLVATVLLPLIAGATAQMTIPAVKQWRVNNKKLLAYLSALCLCMVPWMQVSKASFARLPLTVTSVLAAALAGATVHVAMLLTNIVITSFIRFAKDDKDHVAIRKAVVLCSSQKTLPVAVAVLSQLSGLLGSGAGVAVIPCVLTHLLQTVIDSVLVAQWNKGNMVLT